MVDPKLKKLEDVLNLIDQDFVKTDDFVKIFQEIERAIATIRSGADAKCEEVAEELQEKYDQLEAGFKERLGRTNADVGNKATKDDVTSLKTAIRGLRDDVSEAIESVRTSIPAIPDELTGEEIKEKILKFANWIPVEAIKGGADLVTKSRFEDAIIEIGGKLTLLQKRDSKGYGALGGGSEGTGSLFLSRLRDVDLAGLTKNADGKYVLGSGSGSGGVQSVVAGANITVDNTDPANPIVSATGGGSEPGGNTNNVQLNDGAGGFTGSNNLTYDDLIGLISVPGFTASDGLGNYAQAGQIYDDGLGNSFLSLGGNGTVAAYLNLSTGGGLYLGDDQIVNLDLTGLTADRNVAFQDKDGTIAYLDDITGAYTFDDTDTVNLTDTAGVITADVNTQMSITSDASGVMLVGDEATPGNSEYYGTNGSGTKGYFPFPAGGAVAFADLTGDPYDNTALETALDAKLDANTPITGATKTKITYDADGLVTAGADATTADIADSTNRRYVTDAQLVVVGNTSGTNTGDQTSIVGITGTKSQFDTAVTDGNFLYVGDVTQYTDEMAQDAVGAMTVDGTLVYVDATPSYKRAPITGDISIPDGSNTAAISAGVIINADINASAAIDATKIADGSVTSTEFQYINTLSSNAQTQLDNKQPLDSDLTTIAGLAATTDNFMQAKGSAWASRTVAQVKTDLGLTGTNSGDVTVTDSSTIDFTLTGQDITAIVKTGSIGPTELAATAVTPGAYTSADITVDADGRITAASNGSGGTSQWDNVTGGINYAGGKVGIGQTTPRTTFDVLEATINTPFILQKTGDTGISMSSYYPSINLNMWNDGTQWRSLGAGYVGSWGIDHTTGLIVFGVSGSTTTANQALGSTPTNNFLALTKDQRVGVGTMAPSTVFHVIGTTEQIRTGYDTSNYFSTTVSSAGAVTFNAVGASSSFIFSDAVSGPVNAYASGWNGSAKFTTEDAVYDKIETLQPLDSDLTAIAALSSNGIIARTGTGTMSVRTVTGTTNKITVTNGDGVSGNPTLTVGSDIVQLTDTQTLTNKTLTRRVTTTNAPGATPTINTDNSDIVEFTGLATAITSMTTNLSGTPVNGQFLQISFVDNGTARAITWGTSFANGGLINLPTTTTISVVLRVLLQYQTIATVNKWVCVAIS